MSEQTLYESEVRREFERIAVNDVVFRFAYTTASKMGCSEAVRLKAAIVALSNFSKNLESEE